MPMVISVTPGRPAVSRRTAIRAASAGICVDRVVHGDPPVADRGRPAQGSRAVPADVDRWPGLLDRLGLEGDGREVEELAVVLDDRLAPQLLADGDGLVDPATSGGEVKAHRLPLGRQPTGADAEHGPAARDDVEGGHRPGRDEGVAQADVEDVGAEADLLACGRPERTGRRRASWTGTSGGTGGWSTPA